MAEPSDFNAMNLEEQKIFAGNVKRIRVGLKTSLVEIASAVERMVLPVDPNFAKRSDKLIIHDMVSHNPAFSLHEDRGKFNSSPPFGLYDILNYLISPLH